MNEKSKVTGLHWLVETGCDRLRLRKKKCGEKIHWFFLADEHTGEGLLRSEVLMTKASLRVKHLSNVSEKRKDKKLKDISG